MATATFNPFTQAMQARNWDGSILINTGATVLTQRCQVGWHNARVTAVYVFSRAPWRLCPEHAMEWFARYGKRDAR